MAWHTTKLQLALAADARAVHVFQLQQQQGRAASGGSGGPPVNDRPQHTLQAPQQQQVGAPGGAQAAAPAERHPPGAEERGEPSGLPACAACRRAGS
jgi:hypothetical protein